MDHLSYRFGAPTLPQLCEKVGDIIVDIAGHPVGRLTVFVFSLGKVVGFPIEDMIPAIPMDHDFPFPNWPSNGKTSILYLQTKPLP